MGCLSRMIAGLLVVGLASACSDGGAQPTLVAENAALSTEINAIRATATFQRDELQITIEYMQTAVTQAVRQNQDLAATLVAAGVDPTTIAQIRPDAVIANAPTTPPQISEGTPQATSEVIVGTEDATFEVPTATPGVPTLYNPVMAEGVGDNDCALSPVTSFTSSAKKIYVVATADNITAGTVLGAQWLREGAPVADQKFTPDFAINQKCIWFYVDQTDFPFSPGNYSIQLKINDSPAGTPVAFNITQ